MDIFAYIPLIGWFRNLFSQTAGLDQPLPFSVYTPVIKGKQFKVVGTVTEVK